MYRLAAIVWLVAFALPSAAFGAEPIEPQALAQRIGSQDRSLVVLDVRTPEEYAAGHVPGAINIPHTELGSRLAELKDARDRDVVVYCQSGRRSAIALELLGKAGFTRLHPLEGNWQRWSAEQHPVVIDVTAPPAP